MDREVFLDHLLRASESSRKFAERYVTDTLPSGRAYLVNLNCSYDKKLRSGEVTFPSDVQQHGARVGPLSEEEVVSLLWRDRMVPEWIDVSVWNVDEHDTHFRLICCGRFTSQDQFLYYHRNEVAPFGIKSPELPPRVTLSALTNEPIEKFSLAESRGQTPHPLDGRRGLL